MIFGRRKHLSDRQIVSHIAGELPVKSLTSVCAHLEICEECRRRRDELASVLRDVHSCYREQDTSALLSEEEARRLFQVSLVRQSDGEKHIKLEHSLVPGHKIGFVIAAACASLVFGIFVGRAFEEGFQRPEIVRSMPDSRLTPGATLVLNRQAVCSAANVKNKPVPVVLQRKVLEEYGIRSAAPEAYEVDYLVTPALGGTDDIRNLWPQSFSADWNAYVKDDLEDRLREMVCNGEIELTEAQREIARNWISAYKKYFHTDRPLTRH